MKKNENTKKILFLGLFIVIAAAIAVLPAETESMTRAAWQYLGLFIGMLGVIISGAMPDWAAGLVVCAFLVIFKIDSFANVFKQFSGMSCYDYLIQKRIAHAEALLIQPDLSITEVAMRSGFGSLSTFNRVFKAVKNCTPSEYKNLNPGKN